MKRCFLGTFHIATLSQYSTDRERQIHCFRPQEKWDFPGTQEKGSCENLHVSGSPKRNNTVGLLKYRLHAFPTVKYDLQTLHDSECNLVSIKVKSRHN